MKRFLAVLMMCVLAVGVAFAVPAQGARRASLQNVRATHQPTQRHRAHKAGKHRRPKHPRHHYGSV